MAPATVLAIDIGGTTIKAARVTLDGEAQAQLTIPSGSGDEALENVLSVSEQLSDSSTVAVGVAVPGIVDGGSGLVRTSVNLGWSDIPLAALIENETGLPTHVVHDVRAACIAEIEIGVGKGIPDLMLVAIGTGLSAGIVSGGQLMLGASSSAGEIGHVVVRPDGEKCACGQFGCAEVYASAGGILRRFAALGGSPSLGVARIAASKDPLARRVWADAVDALAQVLATAVVTLDPSLIVLAGGLSLASERLLTPVTAQLQSRLAWRLAPRIVLSPFRAKASLTGAAIEAWRIAGETHAARQWSPSLAMSARTG